MRLTQKLLLVYMPLITIPAVLSIAAVTLIHGYLYREQMTVHAETVLQAVSDKIDQQFQALESAMLPFYTDPGTIAILQSRPKSALDLYRLQQEAGSRYFALMGSQELAWVDSSVFVTREGQTYTIGDRAAFQQALPAEGPGAYADRPGTAGFMQAVWDLKGATAWEVVRTENREGGRTKLAAGRSINQVAGSQFETLGAMLLVVDPDFLKMSLDTKTLGADTAFELIWPGGSRLLDTRDRGSSPLNTLTLSTVNARYGWELQLHLPLSFYKEALRTSIVIAGLITAGCLVVGLFVTRMMATDVVLPIRRLSRSMVRGIGGNEPAQLHQFRGAREIVELKDTFVSVMAEIRELNKEVLLNQKKRQEATMRALENRLAPHFLYNTLNTIRWMAIIQQQDNIKEMVDALTRLLSYSIRDVEKPVPLREELEVLRDYMSIQAVRYEHHTLRIEVPDGLLGQPILKLLIQPLIENAILHGLSKVERPGEIVLHVIGEGRLDIRLSDNGQGLTGEQLARLRQSIAGEVAGTSFGLRSIRERIQLYYGDSYGLTIDSEYGTGTTVSLHLPLAVPPGKEEA
jgi:sensor histidine kinase YesM